MPKKATNTSKTAHVMNLISKNAAPAAPAAPAEPSAEAAAPNPPAAPAAPSAPAAVLPSLNADMEITSQIKSALEDLLEEPPAGAGKAIPEPAAEERKDVPQAAESAAPAEPEEPAQAEEAIQTEEPVTIEASAIAAESVQAGEPVKEETPVKAEEPVKTEETVKAAEPVQTDEPAPAKEEPPAAPVQTEDPEKTVCVNIMQALVEESVERYIHMFGLCSCPRCLEDVKAIALNNLVPKYVVTPAKERSPRVIIYNERYHAEVTAQILRACKTVMDNPLHE